MGQNNIGIVGSGLIGSSFAMLFAAAGYKVKLFDIDEAMLEKAANNIQLQIRKLEEEGQLRGKLSAEAQIAAITTTLSLAHVLQDVVYIQECVPENLEIRKDIHKKIDEIVSDKTVIASSTSSMPASSFSEDLAHRGQIIVAHPTNPPFFCPLVEVVPAPWTFEWVKDETMFKLKEIGQEPVLLRKEIPGFAINRVQYALMSECYRLVDDNVISVEDIDKVMSEGLGMRYAFIGPFEVANLNAEGWLNYCQRYGEMIHDISSSFGPPRRWEGQTAQHIAMELDKKYPLSKLNARRRWRDAKLEELAKLKRKNLH